MTSFIVTVVATLVVALQLAAIVDVVLMPAWAWRGAADAPKRRWILQLALLPGWAVVYYRSADRREVRAHLFRCGGIEPEWHANCALEVRAVSRVDSTVAVLRHRRLIREVIEQAQSAPHQTAGSNGRLAPIHWRADVAAMTQLRAALRAGPLPSARFAALTPALPGLALTPVTAAAPALPPIRWRADEVRPRSLPAPKRHLRLTA